MKKKTILIVDDEYKIRRIAGMALEKVGYGIKQAESAEAALVILSDGAVDCILTDLKMPGMSGIELLSEVRKRGIAVPVIIMTAYGTVKNAVEAMKQGASDFVLKPFDVDSLEVAVSRVFEMEEVRRENRYLKEELQERNPTHQIIGKSAAMEEIFSVIARVAVTDASVLLSGETGTGKELLARLLHEKSQRRNRLFVAVNCAAIPANLLESELFGHVKGAYTGADSERIGRFEKADKGSIFFDEIGDMEPVLQAKILRVLQEREFEKVGSNDTINVDVRVIAATNRDLKELIRKGDFRQDLYYRLNVILIEVPPLRERRDDIPLLAEHFTTKYAREWGKDVVPGTGEVVDALCSYRWPGNVREMENVIERAVALNQTGRVDLIDLPPEIVSPGSGGRREENGEIPEESLNLEERVEKLEWDMISRALRETGNVKSKAAKLLGISERNLWYKLKKYGGKRGKGEKGA